MKDSEIKGYEVRVKQVLKEMGYPGAEAKAAAQNFIAERRRKLEKRNKPDVEIQANSLDRTAGEIIITMHETSDRSPEDVLEGFLKRQDIDPDGWGVKRKMKRTASDGSTAYLAQPVRKPKGSGRSSEDLLDEAEDLDPDQAEELLERLLQQSDG